MKALINGKIILKDGIYKDKVLLMDQKIHGIMDRNDFDERSVEEVIDVKGLYISPGFIDIHIHGSGGRDTMDGTIEALKAISNTILSYGTTGFLPTTMTMEMSKIHTALRFIREARKMDLGGAKILGSHMEGPFIHKKYKGAQNEEYIITPKYEYVEAYLDIIKIITMAPEVNGSIEFIKSIKKEKNITLSIGHSGATYEEAIAAIEAGVSHCTHLFNAMTPLHHRNPGVVGAVFNRNITCELIADKIHVHPELFSLLLKIKGKDHLILVTDAMRAGCMKDGTYDLGGQKVYVREGKVTAPMDGEVLHIMDTKHAIGLKSANGVELLIHIGIDTVEMKGEGFELHVSEGDKVKVGQLLITFDLEKVKEKARSPITPIVITNTDAIQSIEKSKGQEEEWIMKITV